MTKQSAGVTVLQTLQHHLRKDNKGAFSRRPFRDSRTGQQVWRTSQMAEAFLNAKVVKV